MEKKFNIIDNALNQVAKGKEVLTPVVRQTSKHIDPFLAYTKEQAAHQLRMSLKRRIQKAMIPYRLRMGWS